jgi:hypothetical protein
VALLPSLRSSAAPSGVVAVAPKVSHGCHQTRPLVQLNHRQKRHNGSMHRLRPPTIFLRHHPMTLCSMGVLAKIRTSVMFMLYLSTVTWSHCTVQTVVCLLNQRARSSPRKEKVLSAADQLRDLISFAAVRIRRKRDDVTS